MSAPELAAIVVIVLVFLYWFDGLRAIEAARNAGRSHCQRYGLTFLDDTVALERLGLCRGCGGRIGLCRSYRFEFASDGDHRYSGKVEMTGRVVTAVDMQPWRVADDDY